MSPDDSEGKGSSADDEKAADAKAEAKTVDEAASAKDAADEKAADAKADGDKADSPNKTESKKTESKKTESKKPESKKPEPKKADSPKKPESKKTDAKTESKKTDANAVSKSDNKPTASGKKKSGGGVVEKQADIPPTRRHETAPATEPPARPSASGVDMRAPMTYPDDGPFSKTVRNIDKWIGVAEQVALMALFAIVVLTAAGSALSEHIFKEKLFGGTKKDEIIRAGTFTLAMLAGAFAAHQMRHLSMDLVSRRMSPRNRLFLRVFLAFFVIGILLVLIRSSLHVVTLAEGEGVDKMITPATIAKTVPFGASLIILHMFLHALIDLDYIRRRKTPPERMRSGH